MAQLEFNKAVILALREEGTELVVSPAFVGQEQVPMSPEVEFPAKRRFSTAVRAPEQELRLQGGNEHYPNVRPSQTGGGKDYHTRCMCCGKMTTFFALHAIKGSASAGTLPIAVGGDFTTFQGWRCFKTHQGKQISRPRSNSIYIYLQFKLSIIIFSCVEVI